ncbi:MAG: LysR family transcriptional regulator [Betaproteobacteria bacterium]|nr:LysR family transcriptional regulator [Betaproteobacteria bacterium]MDE2124821.1 LysR family transcriptional regulator [Betaproteobacteria bacterium]MDE2187590.1 LysR family transcriptional regulator [Betaproteobacteria bacterium]MDE2325879.1 LysR family transcriptional regulator [Betaproteobacteria bacterium]
MNPNPDVLLAFAESASLGSFSAAARKLGKSQSTISTAIANLEIDLGLELFDRSSRKPTLTEQGEVVLRRVEEVLAAYSQLSHAASTLAKGQEARLSVALSDTYQSDRFEDTLNAFQQHYPDIELECLIAECADLIALVQSGRAQIGFVEQQHSYPTDIGFGTVAERTEIALFVAKSHPLAVETRIQAGKLRQYRELRLATVLNPQETQTRGRSWAAPSYLMLMEMAQRGFGWAPIPRWLVDRFGSGLLHELKVHGWPRQIAVDAVWSRRHRLGPAGTWLLNVMLA